jgi:hypothetical protein
MAAEARADRWTEGRRLVRWLPSIAILVPAVLSLAAWSLPVTRDGLSGYFERAPFSGWGVALLVAWYASLALVAQFAYSRGLRQGGLDGLTRVSVLEVHRVACVVGLFGTAWAYWVATGGSVSQLLELWRTQQFNTLRAGFEYGVGVPTLRYATILAAALTLVHLATRGKPRVLDAASLIGLIATAFLASRLAVVAAMFAAVIVLAASRRRLPAPRLGTVLITVLAAVALFTALNYSRNAGTYREAGVTSPLTMAAINAQSYLATPTQVSLGLSSLAMDKAFDPDLGGGASLEILLPTYTPGDPASAQAPRTPIHSLVEHNPALTTNGAFTSLLHETGWGALLVAIGAVGVAAWGAARFLSSEGIGPAIAGVILYGLAELWRIFLLQQGVLHFLVLIGVAALCLGILRGPRRPPVRARARG